MNETKNIKSIIDDSRVPTDLTDYDERSREIFSRYHGGASLVAKYLKPGGTGDGSSFADAAGNLKTVLEGITDAEDNKVYAVFLTGGTYQAGETIAMKNHVAIIGGVDESLNFINKVTVLDGEGYYRVFTNNSYHSLTNTALLYGATVTGGDATAAGGDEEGGGMYNWNTSPALERVTFSRNTAKQGGGMCNNNSSPTLKMVTFSNNTATWGGGMYNWHSSPSLIGVTFSNNTAKLDGGGINNNQGSAPILEKVIFLKNKAENGGSMYHSKSSATLNNVSDL